MTCDMLSRVSADSCLSFLLLILNFRECLFRLADLNLQLVFVQLLCKLLPHLTLRVVPRQEDAIPLCQMSICATQPLLSVLSFLELLPGLPSPRHPLFLASS